MIEINDALRIFWTQFGLPVFHQNLALDPLPYITFDYGVADFAVEYAITGRLWTRDASHPKISTGFPQIYWDALDSIQKVVQPKTGTTVDLANDSGIILLTRGTPFIVHNLPDDERTIKSALINLDVKYYTK